MKPSKHLLTQKKVINRPNAASLHGKSLAGNISQAGNTLPLQGKIDTSVFMKTVQRKLGAILPAPLGTVAQRAEFSDLPGEIRNNIAGLADTRDLSTIRLLDKHTKESIEPSVERRKYIKYIKDKLIEIEVGLDYVGMSSKSSAMETLKYYSDVLSDGIKKINRFKNAPSISQKEHEECENILLDMELQFDVVKNLLAAHEKRK